MATYSGAYTGAEIDENLGFALNGAAKAWANAAGTGVENKSYNISSITDANVGDNDYNLTNNAASTDECITACAGRAGSDDKAALVDFVSTSQYSCLVYDIDSSTGADFNFQYTSFIGDLA